MAVLRVSGDSLGAFAEEAGGHRWQRVPPTERRGRVHTSTVTVAVLQEPEATELVVSPGDLEWSYCRAGGHGGQHLQKHDTAVQVKHKPTGLIVRCENERSQHQNKANALAVLRARLSAQQRAADHAVRADDRKRQVGSGQRGDKRRTIRVQDGQVTDHVLGRRWQLEKYMEGDW